MTIHVNIGEAKTRLSELVAAAKRGEEVIIARAGAPEVRLVPVDPERGLREISEMRRKAFGSLKGKSSDEVSSALSVFSEEEWEEIFSEDDHLFNGRGGG